MNELQLNNPKDYKEFFGENIESMPKLMAEGRTPLSISDLMRRRLEVLNSLHEVRDFYWNNNFDSGDGIIYYPDGSGMIVLDARPLRELTSSNQLIGRNLVLPLSVCDRLEGVRFSGGDLQRHMTDKRLKKEDVVNNPIWNILARDKLIWWR